MKKGNNKVKTSWRIPKDLVKEFKHMATDKESNVTTLVIQAMKEYLERNSSGSSRR